MTSVWLGYPENFPFFERMAIRLGAPAPTVSQVGISLRRIMAEGEADAVIGYKLGETIDDQTFAWEWDFAAPDLIIHEAGGAMTDLLGHKHLKVITNNLHVAATLADKADFEVLVAGGSVRSDGGVVGQAAADFIQQFKVDFAIVGISGIDEDGSLLDFDYQEVRVSQAIIDNARQVLLAADSSKFGRNAVVRLGSIALIDHLYTDAPPAPGIARLLFTRYVFAFEVTSALLITAAVGAMVLAHIERAKGEVANQVERMKARFQPGNHPAPKAGPGVYATTMSVAAPAKLPDGSDAERSLFPILPPRELTTTEAAPKGTEK